MSYDLINGDCYRPLPRLFENANGRRKIFRVAEADRNFFDTFCFGKSRSFSVEKNFRCAAFVVDDFNVREPRKNSRAQRLKKSLLGSKSCGEGGGGIFPAAFTIIFFRFREDVVQKIFFGDGFFYAFNFDYVRAEPDNHFATKSASVCWRKPSLGLKVRLRAIKISTRRFFCLFSAVSFMAMGRYSP